MYPRHRRTVPSTNSSKRSARKSAPSIPGISPSIAPALIAALGSSDGDETFIALFSALSSVHVGRIHEDGESENKTRKVHSESVIRFLVDLIVRAGVPQCTKMRALEIIRNLLRIATARVAFSNSADRLTRGLLRPPPPGARQEADGEALIGAAASLMSTACGMDHGRRPGKMHVALRVLRQCLGDAGGATGTFLSVEKRGGADEWDDALVEDAERALEEDIEPEIRKLRASLDALVPRVETGGGAESEPSQNEDFDWVDGEEDVYGQTEPCSSTLEVPDSHLKLVDRAVAAMVGGRCAYSVRVDFGEESDIEDVDRVAIDRHRRKLEESTQAMRGRILPNLSRWIGSLRRRAGYVEEAERPTTHGDEKGVENDGGTASSPDRCRRRRGNLLRNLTEARDVATGMLERTAEWKEWRGEGGVTETGMEIEKRAQENKTCNTFRLDSSLETKKNKDSGKGISDQMTHRNKKRRRTWKDAVGIPRQTETGRSKLGGRLSVISRKKREGSTVKLKIRGYKIN